MTGRFLALALLLTIWTGAAESATFDVDSTTDESDLNLDGICETFQGECTLRAAIQEANAQPGPDTINLPAGLYLLDRTGIDNVAGFGDLDVTDTVVVAGAGTAQTTIDAVQRAFQVRTGGDLTLRDLTLRGVDEFSESIQSGCLDVFTEDAHALADNVRFESFAGQNGAFCVSVTAGSFVAERSTFSVGGGHTAMINAYGTAPASITIRDSVVRQEVGAREFMRTGSILPGGQPDLDVTIEGTTFESVSAGNAGGAFLAFNCLENFTRNLTILDSSFSGILGVGGNPYSVVGIYNPPSSLDCDAVIRNSEFADNDLAVRIAGQDGAISQSDVTIENSSFTGNNTALSVGPLGFQASGPNDRLFLSNVTVSGNTDFGLRTYNNAFAFINNSTFSGNGTAVSNEGSNDIFLDNSLLANSSVSDCEGDFTGSFNLIEAGNCTQVNGQFGTIITGADPVLGPLADNGGPTLTHALNPGSPAIDAGDDATCLAIDQRGFSRPADGDGDSTATCDMGAFEKNAVLVANVPPDASDDTAEIDEDTSQSINVAANDTDTDGNLDPTTANTACGTCSLPANGLLANNGDGWFDYTPDADFFGTDSFVYEICDTDAACDTATVDITIASVNDRPVFTAGVAPSFPAGSSGLQTLQGWPQNIDLGPNETQAIDSYAVTTVSDPDGILSGAATISNGGELGFTLTGASGSAQMEATLADDGGTLNGGNDTSAPVAFTITVEPPAADLAARFVLCTSRAAPDEAFAYSLQVDNLGPDDAENSALTHDLPLGSSVTTIGSPDCVDNGDRIDCDLGSIAAGSTWATSVELTMPDVGAQLLSATTSVVATTADPSAGNNDDAVEVEIVPGLVNVDGFESCTP